MRLTIASLFVALHIVSASVLPRFETLEYSTLEGIEAFNKTFAEVHLVHLDGPVLEPATIPSDGLSTRATGNVYMCITRYWSSACQVVHMPNDQCFKSYNFGNPWEDTISSWGADPGMECHLYERRDCDVGGRMLTNVKEPGIANLNDYQFEDIISSARCWYW